MVKVPVALLLDPDLSPSAKETWMGLRLSPGATLAELAGITGLSRHTIKMAQARLTAYSPPAGGARVTVPAALLAERRVRGVAKLVYGLLQTRPGFWENSGAFTFAALSAATGIDRKTLQRAVSDLVGAGWLKISQEDRRKPITFTLGSPDLRRGLAEAAAARQRLQRAKWGGEALLQEYLSLLIDSDDFSDNDRPGWLVNPQTGERLELDRFYRPDFAVEFNGAQHYRATGKFTQEQADAQHFRDLVKAGLCLYRGIHLVIIHPEDLSLQGVARKIGRRMPLRSLEGHEALIELLEEKSLVYRAAVPPA